MSEKTLKRLRQQTVQLHQELQNLKEILFKAIKFENGEKGIEVTFTDKAEFEQG